MALDFSKTTTMAPSSTTTAAVPAPVQTEELAVVEQYDIVADRESMNAQLVNSEEVDRLVSTIEINNLETIVSFGSEVADEISKASDIVLNSMDMSMIN